MPRLRLLSSGLTAGDGEWIDEPDESRVARRPAVPRTGRDLPLKIVGIGILAVGLILTFVPAPFSALEDSLERLVAAVCVIVFSFFFVTGRIAHRRPGRGDQQPNQRHDDRRTAGYGRRLSGDGVDRHQRQGCSAHGRMRGGDRRQYRRRYLTGFEDRLPVGRHAQVPANG